MPRQFTREINGNECIGTSLHDGINPNFDFLDTAAQLLSTNLTTVSASVRTLSGNVINNLRSTNLNITTNVSLVTGLSSYVIPRATKTWLKFDGATITIAPEVLVFSSFNVLSVGRFNTGAYRVQFLTPFIDSNYAITVSPGTSGVYTYTLNPTPSTVEIYSRTVSAVSVAQDSIISATIHSF